MLHGGINCQVIMENGTEIRDQTQTEERHNGDYSVSWILATFYSICLFI